MRKIVTLIVVGMIVYAIFQQYGSDIKKGASLIKDGISQELGKDQDIISRIATNAMKTPQGVAFFEQLLTPKALFSDQDAVINLNTDFIKKMFNIKVLRSAAGKQAVCGHTVTAYYKITEEDRVIEEGTHTFRLGDEKVMPALSNVIAGMRIGEIREANSPSIYAYNGEWRHIKNSDNKQESSQSSAPNPDQQEIKYATQVKLLIELKNISHEKFSNFDLSRIKIFDDAFAEKPPIICGDRVKFDLDISSINGKALLSIKDELLRVGDEKMAIALLYGLVNKIPVGTRTILTPAEFLKNLNGNNTVETGIAENDYVIITIKNIRAH